MNLQTIAEDAVTYGKSLVCSPQAYSVVLPLVRELEEKTKFPGNLNTGPVQIAWSVKQVHPPVISFSNERDFRAYLENLDAGA